MAEVRKAGSVVGTSLEGMAKFYYISIYGHTHCAYVVVIGEASSHPKVLPPKLPGFERFFL